MVLRLLRALKNSVVGLKAAIKREAAFRLELIVSVIVIPLAFYFGETHTQIALLLCSWFLVLIVELLNTAIETVVDRIGLEQHELSGRAKDIGSAAVLIALLNVVVVWALVIF